MMQEAQRQALVIASSEYSDPTLQQLVTPGQDAGDLARVLGDPNLGGFHVQTLINRPSYEIRQEIELFFSSRKKDDLLLLYFSGHGIKDDGGQLYLAAVDTRRTLLRSSAVPASFVNEIMSASRSRRQVLILDCCHSGAFTRGMIPKGGDSIEVGERFEGRGRIILTASNATQYAFQGDQIIGSARRSVFTHYLVDGIETGEADRDGDGWISLDELYDFVHERVEEVMPEQTPSMWAFDVQGRIVLARKQKIRLPKLKPVDLPEWPPLRHRPDRLPEE
jgi:uncharacterized caspase-like protein